LRPYPHAGEVLYQVASHEWWGFIPPWMCFGGGQWVKAGRWAW
jgi:hypothetical protein